MQTEIIDEKALVRLKEVIGGRSEDLNDLIDDFEETAPELLRDIKAAIEAKDWAALRIASHSLKSNAREFGAQALADLCEALEKQAREETVQNADAQEEQIEAGLADARQALSEFKSKNE